MSTPVPVPSEALVTQEWCPIYKWGQKSDKLYITIFVPCVDEQHVKVTLKPDAIDFFADRVAVFAGGKESQRLYKLRIELLGDIDPDESKSFLRHDHVRLELVKKKSATWETLQPAHLPKSEHPWLCRVAWFCTGGGLAVVGTIMVVVVVVVVVCVVCVGCDCVFVCVCVV